MKLRHFETIRKDYDDLRFGLVDILCDPDTQRLYMLKETLSVTKEAHDIVLLQTRARMNLNHPNILKMVHLDFDDHNYIVKAYFEYPNEDLYQRQENLTNPKELLKLLYDILTALTHLEKHRIVHGNLRPEYIYYNEEDDRYVLLDRLGDVTPPNQVQATNILNEQLLYISPDIYDSLINHNSVVAHNPSKSEVFSFGFMILSLLTDEEEVQKAYNKVTKNFDTQFFQMVLNNARYEIFYGGEFLAIGDFMLFCMLNLNIKERLIPKRALKVLMSRFGETISGMEQNSKRYDVKKESTRSLAVEHTLGYNTNKHEYEAEKERRAIDLIIPSISKEAENTSKVLHNGLIKGYMKNLIKKSILTVYEPEQLLPSAKSINFDINNHNNAENTTKDDAQHKTHETSQNIRELHNLSKTNNEELLGAIAKIYIPPSERMLYNESRQHIDDIRQSIRKLVSSKEVQVDIALSTRSIFSSNIISNKFIQTDDIEEQSYSEGSQAD